MYASHKGKAFSVLSVGVTFESLNIYFCFVLNIINIYKMRMTILYTVIHFSATLMTTCNHVQHGAPLLPRRTKST